MTVTNITDTCSGKVVQRSSATTHQRRRKYLIDKRYQFRIAGEFSLIILVGVMLGLINAYFVVTFFRFDSVDLVGQGLWDPSMDVLMWTYSGIVVVVSMIVIFFLSILFSHRIVGPARKLVGCFKRISAGDLTTYVRLRETDHLQEIAGELNQLTEQWRDTMRSLDGRVQSIRIKAEQCGEASILEELEGVQSILGKYKKSELE